MAVHRIASLDEIKPEDPTRVVVEGVPICVVRVGDGLFAVHDTCTHADVSLSEGEIDGEEMMVECWKHGSRFSLEDGRPDTLPATKPVPVYDVAVDGDDVVVTLP